MVGVDGGSGQWQGGGHLIYILISPSLHSSQSPHSSDGIPPHHPDSCIKEALNFFTEFPEWKIFLLILENGMHNDTSVNIIEKLLFFFESLSEETCQKQLFDLPFFYIGG